MVQTAQHSVPGESPLAVHGKCNHPRVRQVLLDLSRGLIAVDQGHGDIHDYHIRLKPEHFEARYNLALALEAQGNVDQAIEYFRKTVELRPDHAMAQARLGMALCSKGAIQEGLAPLSRAVDLDPANIEARYHLAVNLARVNQHNRAISHFLQVLRLNPGNTNALMSLATSYAQTNQIDKALSSLEEALQIAKSAGDQKLIDLIAKQIKLCRQRIGTGKTGR